MKHWARSLLVITIVIVPFLMSGCLSTKSYVDPQYRKASYNDIAPVAEAYLANLEVEFQLNGEHKQSVDATVRSEVEKALYSINIIVPTNLESELILKVTVNNIADLGKARAKGFGTGLTFGAAGSTVTDFYDIKIELYKGNEEALIKNYKHAIHTTIGNKPAPLNVEPATTAVAFSKVIEDAILNFIKDLQNKNMFLTSDEISNFTIIAKKNDINLLHRVGAYQF
jgi:hypothetical protein